MQVKKVQVQLCLHHRFKLNEPVAGELNALVDDWKKYTFISEESAFPSLPTVAVKAMRSPS